jgi:hypothetical protein
MAGLDPGHLRTDRSEPLTAASGGQNPTAATPALSRAKLAGSGSADSVDVLANAQFRMSSFSRPPPVEPVKLMYTALVSSRLERLIG